MDGNYTVLIIGGGAREHALAWALEGECSVARVLVSPGNPAMVTGSSSGKISLVPPLAHTPDQVAASLRQLGVHLVVVGPEEPLVEGLADMIHGAGVPVLGPCRQGALLEGSKIHTRELCARLGIPQPRWTSHHSLQSALARVNRLPRDCRVVVKADGLAGGKGALLCANREEAAAAVRKIMGEQVFGQAGRSILIEEWLEGWEASLIVLTDGERAIPLPVAADYKRLQDGDRGPNTGGMGAVAPNPLMDDRMVQWAMDHMVHPILGQLKREGVRYRGFLYLGLMVPPTDRIPRLLEINVRLGDPEAQVLLPLMVHGHHQVPPGPRGASPSLLSLFMGAATGKLGEAVGGGPVHWEAGQIPSPGMEPETAAGGGAFARARPGGWEQVGGAVGVVLASKWYPDAPPPQEEPAGSWEELEKLLRNRGSGGGQGRVLLFGGGVKSGRAGEGPVSRGGRLVTVVGLGNTLGEAGEAAYGFIGNHTPDGIIFRRDIGDTSRWLRLAKVG